MIPRLRPVREGGGCTAAAVCLYSRELLLYSGAVIPRLCPVCEGEPWGGDNTVGTVFPNSKKVNINSTKYRIIQINAYFSDILLLVVHWCK